MQSPSIAKQKIFIKDNEHILDAQTEKSIYTIVQIMSPGGAVCITKSGEVNINLDAIERTAPDIITHIYYVVRKRRDFLSSSDSHRN